MMMEYIHSILLIGTIAFFWIWLKWFFPSYFKTKGQNLATKQDIGEITAIIESTKKEYTKELERIKSELQVLNVQKAMLKEKSYEALTDFFETVLILARVKFKQNLGELGPDFKTDVIDYQKSVDSLFVKLSVDYHKLALYYFDNEEIIKASNDVLIAANQVKLIYKKYFWKVKTTLLAEAHPGSPLSPADKEKYKQAVNESDEAGKEYYNNLGPQLDKFSEAFNNYISVLTRHFKSIGTDFKFGQTND
jgi:hypothetical protein